MSSTGIAKQCSADRRAGAERVLIGMELITGAAGLAGGLLLALSPDGSLLRAQMSALENAPFTDWRLPGLLLASLVGSASLAPAGGSGGVDRSLEVLPESGDSDRRVFLDEVVVDGDGGRGALAGRGDDLRAGG
jgi:hypothetical protein